MPAKPRAAISWSGGKDSYTAFELARLDFDVVAAMTMIDDEGRRSRSHGLRIQLLHEQTAAMGLAHVMRPCDWPTYETAFVEGLRELRAHDVSHVVFGDIVYPEHRVWAERMAQEAGLVAVEPLWGRTTTSVVDTFLRFGGRALIVTVNASVLNQSWLGVELTPVVVNRLVQLGVDPCGENGEYHTFVINAPGFARPVDVTLGEIVAVRGTWAIDLSASGLPVEGGRPSTAG